MAKTAVQHLSVGAKMMSRMLKEEVTSNREQQGTANEIQNSLLVKIHCTLVPRMQAQPSCTLGSLVMSDLIRMPSNKGPIPHTT